jgi:hypothetical protein
MKPTWGLLYWPAFIYTVTILWGVPEAYAFFTNHRNTLSDFAWYELGIKGSYGPHSVSWWASLILVLAIGATLIGHIWFQTPD